MTGPTHLVTGLTCAVMLGYSSPSQLAVVGVASLIADIDRKQSLLGRFIPILPTMIESIFGKRTITHSWLMLLLAIPIYFIWPNFWVPFLIGFLLHILLDIPTGNVFFLWPIPLNFHLRFGIAPSFIETLFLIGLGVYYAFNWREVLSSISFLSIGG